MTATTVRGIPVVDAHRVPSPLSTPERPIYFTRLKELVLSDGSTIFGCTECDFTDESAGLIRGHLGSVHRDPNRPPKQRRSTAKKVGINESALRRAGLPVEVNDLIARLSAAKDVEKVRTGLKEARADLGRARNSLANVRRSRDSWRVRALDAEQRAERAEAALDIIKDAFCLTGPAAEAIEEATS